MILGLKLINSEELIGDCDLSRDTYTIKNPMRLIITPEGMGMMPWVLWSDDNSFEVSKNNVLVTFTLKREVENAYISQTGGIVSAPAGVLNNKGKLVL